MHLIPFLVNEKRYRGLRWALSNVSTI